MADFQRSDHERHPTPGDADDAALLSGRDREGVRVQPGSEKHHRRTFLAAIAAAAGAGIAGVWWIRRRIRNGGPGQSLLNDGGLLDLDTADATTPHPTVPDAEPTVRVRIRTVRKLEEPIYIGSEGQWMRLSNGASSQRNFSITMRGPLRIYMAPDGTGAAGHWSILDDSGYRAPAVHGDVLTVKSFDLDPEQSTLRLGNRSYPGELRLVRVSDTTPLAFDVVNYVGLEHYLPGVVARELYSHWHFETHAAQAIAARSFACAEHAYFTGRRHFDMTDTQASQVYGGVVTHPTSLEAVAVTRGMVLAYGDLLVPGYYSSCCGGLAATATDAIGPNPINAIAPLNGRADRDVCTEVPACRWQTQRNVDSLTKRINAFGEQRNQPQLAELGRPVSIEVARSNDHGRPTHYNVADVDGTVVEVRADVLRRAANHTGPGMRPPARALRSSHMTATFTDDDVLLEGYGFGHGVGMCQHGAQVLARRGWEHRAILQWYYPGVEIVTAYGGDMT